MPFKAVSPAPPKRGEGQGEGFVIFSKTKLLTPTLSSFSEDNPLIQCQ